ncbi:MAG TPA: carboxypeptidase-like regulatory domain-containing protein [Paludibaculum sp.]
MKTWLLVLLLPLAELAPHPTGSVSVGKIRGAVVHRGGPLSNAQVRVSLPDGVFVQSESTGSDGSYEIGNLPASMYVLKITANGFYSAEVRDVQSDGLGVVVVPAVRLEFAAMGACGEDLRPTYYRLRVGAAESGAVGGAIRNNGGGSVAGANVTLLRKNLGPISSQATQPDGKFSFVGLNPNAEEYWISIEREGYFSEEVRHLRVSPGLEAVYPSIMMESCSPGRCQPHLKTPYVAGFCG